MKSLCSQLTAKIYICIHHVHDFSAVNWTLQHMNYKHSYTQFLIWAITKMHTFNDGRAKINIKPTAGIKNKAKYYTEKLAETFDWNCYLLIIHVFTKRLGSLHIYISFCLFCDVKETFTWICVDFFSITMETNLIITIIIIMLAFQQPRKEIIPLQHTLSST